jgi:hypothetical protein
LLEEALAIAAEVGFTRVIALSLDRLAWVSYVREAAAPLGPISRQRSPTGRSLTSRPATESRLEPGPALATCSPMRETWLKPVPYSKLSLATAVGPSARSVCSSR